MYNSAFEAGRLFERRRHCRKYYADVYNNILSKLSDEVFVFVKKSRFKYTGYDSDTAIEAIVDDINSNELSNKLYRIKCKKGIIYYKLELFLV